MPSYNEIANKRLIPVGVGHQIYDITATGFGTVIFYAGPGVYEYNVAPFAISVYDDGNVIVSQQAGTESLNPGDAFLLTIMQITSYRTYTIVNGTVVISPAKSALALKVRGQTVITDTTAPTVANFSPTGAAIPIDSDITLTFSENVKAGTGNVVLWNETTNTQFAAYDITSSPYVTISLSQLIINPPGDLPYGSQISVRMASGVILDLANNAQAAITGSVYSFTTVVFVTPISNMDPDIILTSVAQINSTLTSWAASPSTTVPAGKTALQDRVIGVSTILAGMSISGKNMPMNVFIRPVGSFTEDNLNGAVVPACSTYINGAVTITGCTNLYLWRCDIRAANGTTAYLNGLCHFSGCTRSGPIKCVARGWPHLLINDNTLARTGTGFRNTGGTDCVFDKCAAFFCYDSDFTLFGNSTRFTWRGIMGRFTGGNQFKIASSAVANDLLMEYCHQPRAYHPYKSLHGDFAQWNTGARVNRYIIRFNTMYHGHWTTEYYPNPNGTGISNSTQTIFSSPGGATQAGDQNLFEQNFLASTQQRGVDRMPGPAILTTRYNTMLEGLYPLTPIKQTGTAPFPRIINTDITDFNYITGQAGNATMVLNQGPNGIDKRLSTNRAEILDDHMAIPTDLTDLYDVRPKSGQRTDPLYSNPAQRVGCYSLWSKLLLGDSNIVLSKQGWPVATIFLNDFDPQNRFLGTHNTNYDNNGDSI